MALSDSEQTVLMIKGAIASLSTAQHAECMALYRKVGQMLSDAPDPLGTFVVALIGAELQLKSEQSAGG